MTRTVLLSTLLALVATPAGATCVEVVSELEQRIVAADGAVDTAELRTSTTRVEVDHPPGGTTPTESWGGASSGFVEARDKLANARLMAEDGDEDGCLVLVEEARLIVQHLAR